MHPLPDTGYGFDFYLTWTFGFLASKGLNPYDQTLIRSTLASLNLETTDPILGYPPWTMWYLGIIGAVNFQVARYLWLILSAATSVFYSLWSIRLVNNETRHSPISFVGWALILLSFSPLINSFRWGQINFVICLAFLGFYYYREKGMWRSSGLCLPFIFSKPHLAIPLLSYLFFRMLLVRKSSQLGDRSILIWCVIGTLFHLILSFLMSPASFAMYPANAARTIAASAIYDYPTIATILSHATGISSVRLMFVPLGVLLGLLLATRSPASLFKDFILILLGTFLLAPYCASHNFVVFLPSYIYVATLLVNKFKQKAIMIICMMGFCQYALLSDRYGLLDVWMVFLPILILIGMVTLVRPSFPHY